MTIRIIDSDDLGEAVAISARDDLDPSSAIATVIAKNGRYWFPDVNKLCPSCLATLDEYARTGTPSDFVVICRQCQSVGERVKA